MSVPSLEQSLVFSSEYFLKLTQDYWNNPEKSPDWFVLSNKWVAQEKGFSTQIKDNSYLITSESNTTLRLSKSHYDYEKEEEHHSSVMISLDKDKQTYTKEGDSEFDQGEVATILRSAINAVLLLSEELYKAMSESVDILSDRLTHKEMIQVKLLLGQPTLLIPGWKNNNSKLVRELENEIITINAYPSGRISIHRLEVKERENGFVSFNQDGTAHVVKDDAPAHIIAMLKKILDHERAAVIVRELLQAAS